LSFVESGWRRRTSHSLARAISDMVAFCLTTSREDVPSHDGSTVSVVTALAPLPHPRFSNSLPRIKQDLVSASMPDCDTTACSFSAATQAAPRSDPQPPLLDSTAAIR